MNGIDIDADRELGAVVLALCHLDVDMRELVEVTCQATAAHSATRARPRTAPLR